MAEKVDGISVEINLDDKQFLDDLNNAEKETDKTAKEMEKAFQEANENITEDFSNMASSIGDVLAGVTAGIVGMTTAIGGMAFNSIVELDSAMSQLQASTGATTEQMEEFEDIAKGVYGNNYGENWEDVANAIAIANKQLKVQGDALQSVTEQAFAIQSTFDVEVGESIRSVKVLMEQFGVSSDEAMNLITQGFQQNLDFSGEFLDSINEYSVHFEQLGLDAEDMFNIFLDGTENGAFNLDKIGDAVKELGIKVKEGSANDALKELGLNAEEIVKNFNEGGEKGQEAFYKIFRALNQVNDETKLNQVGTELMGTMFEDLGKQAVLSLGNMSDGFNRATESAETLSEVKYDNIGSAFEGIKRSVEVGALIPIGEKFLPLVNEFANWVATVGIPRIVEFADSFGQSLAGGLSIVQPLLGGIGNILLFMFENINVLIPALLGLVTAFKGYSILTTVTTWFGTLQTAIIGAGGVIPWITGLIGAINLPILAVVGALGALVFAFSTNFGGIRDITFNIFSFIRDFLTETWETIKSNWGNTIDALVQFVTLAWENIKLYINTAMTLISGIITTVLQVLKGDWQGAWETIKNTVATVWENMKQIVANMFNAIVNLVLSIGVDLANAMYNGWKKATAKAEEVWNNLCSWFSRAINNPVQTILNIGGALYNAGASMIRSVWNGCKSIWNNVVGWFNEKVNWIKDKLTFWKSAEGEMAGSGRGRSFEGRLMQRTYGLAAANYSTNVTFSGNYSFRDKNDIDYFMKRAGMEMKKTR